MNVLEGSRSHLRRLGLLHQVVRASLMVPLLQASILAADGVWFSKDTIYETRFTGDFSFDDFLWIVNNTKDTVRVDSILPLVEPRSAEACQLEADAAINDTATYQPLLSYAAAVAGQQYLALELAVPPPSIPPGDTLILHHFDFDMCLHMIEDCYSGGDWRPGDKVLAPLVFCIGDSRDTLILKAYWIGDGYRYRTSTRPVVAHASPVGPVPTHKLKGFDAQGRPFVARPCRRARQVAHFRTPSPHQTQGTIEGGLR